MGFTLTEVLIALAILAIISVFTIPKVLQGQQDKRNTAIIKEAAGTLSSIQQLLIRDRTLSASTTFTRYLPYLNYITIDDTSEIDDVPDQAAPRQCGSGGWRCIRLHNGSVLQYHGSFNSGGSASNNAFYVYVDPDGKVTNGGGDSGKAVQLFIYMDGAIKTGNILKDNTVSGFGNEGNTAGADPSWFSW